MSALVPEKPSRMDNGGQLFGTFLVRALGLHCCIPSRPLMQTVNSFLMGFPRVFITILPMHIHARTLWKGGRRPSGLWVHTSVCLCAWERRVMPAPRFCQLSPQSCWPGPALLLQRHHLGGPHFHSLQPSSSIIAHLAPFMRREARFLQTTVSPAPLDASILCVEQAKNFMSEKTPSDSMTKTATGSFLQGDLWLEFEQPMGTCQSFPTTQSKGRLRRARCPTLAYLYLLWTMCNAHKGLDGNKASGGRWHTSKDH